MTAFDVGLVGAGAGLFASAVMLAEATGGDRARSVVCEQAGAAVPRPPQPKWNTVDMPGSIGVDEYAGQDPYEFLLPIRLDGYPSQSVEAQVRTLEGFAETRAGDSEPAVLIVSGAVPLPHPNLQWRLVNVEDPSEQLWLPGGKERCRYVTTLTLRQHVTGANVAESIRNQNGSKVIRTRITSVRAGENDLFDVARRYYHDTSRATDIARANLLSLGGRLRVGQKLRMPS